MHSRNLRSDTQRSYRSKLKQFTEWCERRSVGSWLCSRFTAQLASEFLTQYDNNGKRSAYSYNDMLRFVKSMFTGFISAGLARTNPFESFKPRKRETKHRTVIPKQDRKRHPKVYSSHSLQTERGIQHGLPSRHNGRFQPRQFGDIPVTDGGV